jgi:hypothetical protein
MSAGHQQRIVGAKISKNTEGGMDEYLKQNKKGLLSSPLSIVVSHEFI